MTQEDEYGSLLTNRQRKHMASSEYGEGDSADRSERSRIRKRLRNTVIDFRFLFENITQADRDTLCDVDGKTERRVHDGIVAAIAFFYEIHLTQGWDFKETLERAMKDVYKTADRTPKPKRVKNVEFDSEIKPRLTQPELQRNAMEKFQNGYTLTDEEFRALVQNGGLVTLPDSAEMLSTQDIIKTLRERRKEQYKDKQIEEAKSKVEKDQEMFGELNPDTERPDESE